MPKNDKDTKEYETLYNAVYRLHDKSDVLDRVLKLGNQDTSMKANDLKIYAQHVKRLYKQSSQKTRDAIFTFYAKTVERAEMLADQKQVVQRR